MLQRLERLEKSKRVCIVARMSKSSTNSFLRWSRGEARHEDRRRWPLDKTVSSYEETHQAKSSVSIVQPDGRTTSYQRRRQPLGRTAAPNT